MGHHIKLQKAKRSRNKYSQIEQTSGRAGLFLAFQYPLAIPSQCQFHAGGPGAHRGWDTDMSDFRKLFKAEMAALDIEDQFAARVCDDGFSGGEKNGSRSPNVDTQAEMAILNETDSIGYRRAQNCVAGDQRSTMIPTDALVTTINAC